MLQHSYGCKLKIMRFNFELHYFFDVLWNKMHCVWAFYCAGAENSCFFTNFAIKAMLFRINRYGYGNEVMGKVGTGRS